MQNKVKDENILKVVNLTKRFSSNKGVVDAVNHVSFEVKKGQFFGIIGESGSGKTTLGRTIIGLYDSTYGSVYFENELINLKKMSLKKKRWRQKNIQMIFQDPMSSLNGKKNVLSLISEPLKINKEYWNDFKKHMALNKKVIMNFRFKLEKIFRKKELEYLLSKYKKAFDSYKTLSPLVDKMLIDAPSLVVDDIIDFIEMDYYEFLISRNNEVLKNIRVLLNDFRDLYDEVENNFLNNKMDEDEIIYNNASKKVIKLKQKLKGISDEKVIAKKVDNLNKEVEKVKNEMKEKLLFTKNFVNNFKKAIKISFKDEHYKKVVTNTADEFQKHNQYKKEYHSLYQNISHLPKKMILNQTEIDMFEAFKKTFTKNLGLDNDSKNELLWEKLSSKVLAASDKNKVFYNEKLTKLKTEIIDLREKLAGETTKFKASLVENKVKNHQELKKAILEEKEAKNTFETISKDVILEMAQWRKEFLIQRKIKLEKAKNQFVIMKKQVVIKFNEINKILKSKINQNIKTARTEMVISKTGEINFKNKNKAAYLHDTKSLKKLYAQKISNLKKIYQKVVDDAKNENRTKEYSQYLGSKKIDFKHNLKHLKNELKQKLFVVKEQLHENKLMSFRKRKKEEVFKSKVNKHRLLNLIKETNLKRKAVEVEVKLENKQINNIKTLFGMTRYPRFIVIKKAKKNHLNQVVGEYLTKVGLKPEHAYRYPHEFSGGQRQRIGIARAIITKPKLIIADEPISALDVSIQAQIVNILKDLSAELGSTLIFIAHDLSMVHYICDTVVIMSRGRIVEKGSTREIFQSPRHPYTKELLNSVPELSEIHKNLAKKIKNLEYKYDNNKEYDFRQIDNKNHYILANEQQEKDWTN